MPKRSFYQLCEHSDDNGDEEEVAAAAAAARLVAAEADAAAARGTVAYGNAAAALLASADDDVDGIPAGWQWQVRDVPMRELAAAVVSVPVAEPRGFSVRACPYTDVRLLEVAAAVGSVRVALPVPVPGPVPLPVPVPVLGPCPCRNLPRAYRPISCPCRLVEKTSARSWHAR